MGFVTFQGSAPGTLGVELELQVIDAETLALRPDAERLIAALPESVRGSVKPEFYRSNVELISGICQDVEAVGRDLEPKVRALHEAAEGLGLRIGWGGSHPFSRWPDQLRSTSERYQQIEDRFQDTLRRQMTFGLHVHVGVADGDAAARACDAVRAQLPALVALAANSPFWSGRPTGLQSQRAEVMGNGPTNGLPAHLGSWDGYNRLFGRLLASGCVTSPKDLWWDVRPSPKLGTVEVRACDMPADLPTVLALTSLIQCLILEGAQGGGPEFEPDEVTTLLLRQNRWRAARHGLDAELIDLNGGSPVPARGLVGEMIERLADMAERLGCSESLAKAAALAEGPTAADRQLAVYERTGSLTEVARLLVGDLTPLPVAAGVGEATSLDPWVSGTGEEDWGGFD